MVLFTFYLLMLTPDFKICFSFIWRYSWIMVFISSVYHHANHRISFRYLRTKITLPNLFDWNLFIQPAMDDFGTLFQYIYFISHNRRFMQRKHKPQHRHRDRLIHRRKEGQRICLDWHHIFSCFHCKLHLI